MAGTKGGKKRRHCVYNYFTHTGVMQAGSKRFTCMFCNESNFPQNTERMMQHIILSCDTVPPAAKEICSNKNEESLLQSLKRPKGGGTEETMNEAASHGSSQHSKKVHPAESAFSLQLPTHPLLTAKDEEQGRLSTTSSQSRQSTR